MGEAARAEMLVTARCRGCGHAASFLASDLASVADPALALDRLPFRCRECRLRDCEVNAEEIERDRRPGIVIWRPTRLR
ncbi:hypothetical protein GTW51_18895 [Aurantimonas aggregata]|uniref:Uncharacterized protein n=1 Tax=Aurantimonas aggregata TaxID=2047720 RepID=A0A6L9MMB3_9HYPH|nr:hypothetical protein [Aurantimonas aggregata]